MNQYKPFEESMIDFLEFSTSTFKEANQRSSLIKFSDEFGELIEAIEAPIPNRSAQIEEYVDCLMCLIDSAMRGGITPLELKEVFELKTSVNLKRKWIKHPNGTYSHSKI